MTSNSVCLPFFTPFYLFTCWIYPGRSAIS
jgi:hypothetical protein